MSGADIQQGVADFPKLHRPWAKLHRDCGKGRGDRCRAVCSCPVSSVLSLIGHSADVAAVMQALLEQPNIAARLARLLGRSALTTEHREILIALTALHDLGKVNQGFQRKPFVKGKPVGHVTPVITLLEKGPAELQTLLQQGSLNRLLHILDDPSGNLMPFAAIMAHHGGLPCAAAHDPGIWRAAEGYDPVLACRHLVDAIAEWCPHALSQTPLEWTPAFQHAFAGLLMLADWLGSDLFGAGLPDDVARYKEAIPRATDLLRRRGIAPERARAAASGLSWDVRTLTSYGRPSPAQAAMLELLAPSAGGRTCVIEDETGSGKTEAALIHFLDLFRRGEVDGMYFALPTRAAARQIHGRIKAALQGLLGEAAPHVTLAVPGYLGRELADAPLSDASMLWPEDERTEDALWSSERPKRYLASWVAVGTIDQVLMGGLRVRYAQLRSSAMLRSLLVVDEVHASDIYMTTILRNVLDQHRRAGGHALLMSATLGAAARAALLKVTDRVKEEDYAVAVARPYPAIWTDAQSDPLDRPSVMRAQKHVRIVLETNWSEPGAIVAQAVDAARRGARVLVIRNTVRDVMATQTALEVMAPDLSLSVAGTGGPVMTPHHARYAPEDRARLDAALEAVLGKDSNAAGSVTITSQTAEQSLDIDADLLITDLCPADVLLQRIGRLHRHHRPRPAGFEAAMAIVLAPTEAELAASIRRDGEVKAALLALGLVYPNLLGVVATRRRLAALGTICIPRDNRRLVEAATHPGEIKSLAEQLRGVFMAHWKAYLGTRGAHATAADNACLKWREPIEPLPPINERIATRLGLDDRTVEFLSGTIGPFGGEISVVSVPGRWLGGVPADATAGIEATPSGLVIQMGSRAFVYDRFGIRPA